MRLDDRAAALTWRPGAVAGVVASAVAGFTLAIWVVFEPWLLPRLAGGLFFRWHEFAAVVVLTLLGLAIAVGRALTHMPFDRWLLALTIAALQMMALRIGPLNLLNICIVLMLLWWLIDLARNAREPRETPLLVHLLVAFAVLAMVSVLGDQQSGGLTALLPKLLMAGIVSRMLRTEADLRFAMRWVVIVGIAAALVGIMQSAAFVFLGLELHRMDDDSPRFIQVFGFNMLRAPGLSPNPQSYCHALAVALLLLGHGWLTGGTGYSRWNPLIVCAGLVMIAAVGLSFARGAWAAVGFGLAVLPAVAWPRRAFHWFVVLGVLTLVGLWTGGLTYALSAYRGFTLTTTEVRVELLATGLQTLAEHPWRGVGISNFEFYSPALERYPVHNSVLQVATETGVFGALIFLAIICIPMVRAALALRHARGGRADLIRGMLLAYVVYMIAIQSEPSGYSELVFFLAALLDATARIAGNAERPVTLSMSISKAVT